MAKLLWAVTISNNAVYDYIGVVHTYDTNVYQVEADSLLNAYKKVNQEYCDEGTSITAVHFVTKFE
jgi:hypothetical protein